MWYLGLLSSFLGICLGGGVAWIFKSFIHRIDTIQAICTGAIFCLLSVEILPEALEIGEWFSTVVGLSLGIISFELLHNEIHNDQPFKSNSKNKRYVRTGFILLLSVSIHNIPIGMTLGVNQHNEFKFTLLQTLFLHSIPEGIIIFTPLFLAGMNKMNWLFISFFVSIPVAIGVMLGGWMEIEHERFSGVLISFTVGIIMMVTVKEILWPLIKKALGWRLILSILMGFIVMGLYLLFI